MPKSRIMPTTGKLRFFAATTSRAPRTASTTKKPASRTAAGSRPTNAEPSTASRATNHNPNRLASGHPAIGSRPVQLGIAVSRNPHMIAPTKPNSISWRCQASGSNAVGSVSAPERLSSHKAMAITAQLAPPKKNGRNPPRRIGGEAAIRRRRSASICSPRVTVGAGFPSPTALGRLRLRRLGRIETKLGRLVIVDLARALVGLARGQPVAVAKKAVALGEHSELHREHDLRTDIDVGGGEAVAADVIAKAQELVDNGDRALIAAVAEHPLLILGRIPAHDVVGPGLLPRPGGVEEPAVIVGLLVLAWPESGLREDVGEIGADRRAFGDDMALMPDRRHFPERVDGEILGALHPVVSDDFGVVRLSDLLEHPADDPPARLGIGVEDELGHVALPTRVERKANYSSANAGSSIPGIRGRLTDRVLRAAGPERRRCARRRSHPALRGIRCPRTSWAIRASWRGGGRPGGAARHSRRLRSSPSRRAIRRSAGDSGGGCTGLR